MRLSPDSLRIGIDTLAIFDQSAPDTLKSAQPKPKKKSSAIKTKVEYSATDSIVLDLGNQKVFMYREADIKYDKIQQKAAYIEINFSTNMLKARPLLDSAGKPYGKPEFIEGQG